MPSPFTTFEGTSPAGVDILRERARWAAAERRWHHPAVLPVPDGPPPPPYRGALQDGAKLTRFTDAQAARSP
ncbi:hypothetical protein HL658_21395 [Azospirillum sp. RWY-5-1]|uniref:Uncharacterized protein n=1 Tax=Azospirillum oleiclasticum TaxID=2735135 RepID=A0ABX2TI64_9PROT|nr:hypothetical protein [Azospirillum oleiclasticum]NYZ15106.1 hypothetical protein [Azospirillum oleiclasticum]NYZ22868.1 hypothetical protein [Azospirillum oleiclasticum]